MRQELVFIGQRLDKERMIKALNECLLSDDEMDNSDDHWSTFNDPFPKWEQIQ